MRVRGYIIPHGYGLTGSQRPDAGIQRRIRSQEPEQSAATVGAAERRHISGDRRSAAGLARYRTPAYHPERRRTRRSAAHCIRAAHHAGAHTIARQRPQNASPEQSPQIAPDCVQLIFYHVTIRQLEDTKRHCIII
jgi:hypothetical protein